MRDKIGAILGWLIVATLLALSWYGLMGVTLWDWNPSEWPEIARAGVVLATVVSAYLWSGGSLRSAVERLW